MSYNDESERLFVLISMSLITLAGCRLTGEWYVLLFFAPHRKTQLISSTDVRLQSLRSRLVYKSRKRRA